MTATLKNSEKAILLLRSLFESRGYSHFKMSRFEEYDIYAANKDFLVGEGIITFTDPSGRLMALKPDVTMSIIKNSNDDSINEKFYYNENVYRVDGGSHQLKEFMQSGLECIGDIDLYNTCEVIGLALESLSVFGKPYVLDISHMGIVSGIIEEMGVAESMKKELLACVAAKNTHGIEEICMASAEKLIKLMSVDPEPEKALPALRELCQGECLKSALSELESIIDVLRNSAGFDNIRLDFSVVQDISYYNGVVFQGFVMGLPEKILSGGRYDLLMRRIGKEKGAIGFGITVDPLERLVENHREYDFDIAVLYSPDSDIKGLKAAADKLCAERKRVAVVTVLDKKAKYRNVMKFEDGELKNVN